MTMDRDTVIATLQAVLTDATAQLEIAEQCNAGTTRAYALGRQSALEFALALLTEPTTQAAGMAQTSTD